jgi:MFS family permease
MGAGSLLGAAVAGPLSRRFKFGTLVVSGSVIIAFASLLTPAATLVPKPAAVVLLLVMQILNASMVLVCNINIRSYRASITPDDLQGRMNAIVRMAVMSGAPFGALFGGLLGTWFGTPVGLVAASAGMFIAAGVLGFSPVRHVTGIGAQARGQTAEVVT